MSAIFGSSHKKGFGLEWSDPSHIRRWDGLPGRNSRTTTLSLQE
jgi:hypothetical protein